MFSQNQRKLSLSSSTKISLHDRFTKLEKIKSNTSNKVAAEKAFNLSHQKASAKNRRLVLQMANRPSVQAALKLKKKSIRQKINTDRNRIKNKSVIGRPNQIAKRLGNRLRNKNRLGPRKSGIDPSRLSINGKPLNNRLSNLKQRLSIDSNRRPIGRNLNKPYQNSIKNRLGPKKKFNQEFNRFKIGANNKREQNKNQQVRTRIIRNNNYQNKNNGNRKQNVPRSRNVPNASSLDNDLDNYMTKRTNALNLLK
ncbi:unnamed protein product [Brachionus calyciflorus]|uniref:Chromatin target of PRMT1 protein C-terminal domain-containing protein n=1 Tax=Brachionus calyciflorus TaxID=104777 RepID=A0A813R1B3_9BILA|nr:unnamed protein product [Brachionus calyciflorus]